MKIAIEFEDENLTQLLKAVFLGSWVRNATRTGDEADPAMDTFEQYVLGTLWNAGEKRRITVTPQGRYGFAEDFSDALFEQVDEYDSDVFWEELVDQLARRDYFQKNPAKAGKVFEGAAALEVATAVDREKDKYDKEFEENGLERLRLVR